MKVACHKVTVAAVTFLFAFCSTMQMSSAQETPPPESVPAPSAAPAPIDLDLASTAASVTFAANNAAAAPVNIDMAGVMQTVNPGQMVTAAQAVAAYQVMRTGAQSIVLGAMGEAIGGTMNISPWLAANLGSLVIPSGVSVINNFASNPALNLAGSLTNAGTFYAVSTNPLVSTASIAALNIANQQSALLTSVLPQGGLAGYSNAISNLSLSLSAINNIVNAGVISSAGTLSMTAGGSITNAANMAGISAVMQAMNNVNLNAASIVNSGLISSITGNINVASQLSDSAASQALQALNVNNVGGIMQALNGSINVGNILSSGNTNISLYGGDWMSKALNVNAGLGSVTATLGQLTGALCVQAGAAHVFADTSVLKLGNTKIEGDPTFVSTGDIELDGQLTAAQSLSLIAQGNIYIPNSASVSISTTGTNSDITLIAGATVSCPSCPSGSPIPNGGGTQIGALDTATVTFTPANGGYINLYTNNTFSGSDLIDASASTGNVTLAAYSNGTDTGFITLMPTSGHSIKTAGDGSGLQGNVTIIAGGTLSSDDSGVNAGNIRTSNSGAISISTSQPIATSLVYNSDGTHTGTLTADATLNADATVVVGDLTTSGANAIAAGQNGGTAGQITIAAGGAVETGDISGSGGSGITGGPTGQAGGAGGDGSSITLTSQNASIATGSIIANGGVGAQGGLGAAGGVGAGGPGGNGGFGGNGGTLLFTANTSISTRSITTNAGNAGSGGVGGASAGGVAGTGGIGGTGGTGGTIDFIATTTFIDITQGGATLTAIGGTGGAGGTGGNGGSNAGGGGVGGVGGLGGCVCLSAGTSLNVGEITVNGAIGGTGGDAGTSGAPGAGGLGGIGGDGGSVTLQATTTLDAASMTSIGGIAGPAGNGSQGGPGGSAGGNGGFVQIITNGDIGSLANPIGAIVSSGGNGSIAANATPFIPGSTGGAGGAGGTITIQTDGNVVVSTVASTGGNGASGGGGSTIGGNGGAGGAGGDITVTSNTTGPIGFFTATSLSSTGGTGGKPGGASTSAAGTGGTGGNGGQIDITSSFGLVSGMTLNSTGGDGGNNAGTGSNQGNGGNGGNASAITVTAPPGISQINIFSLGGDGQDGGGGPGAAGVGGNGGNTGAVTLTSASGDIDTVDLQVIAGSGGAGGDRSTPGVDGSGGLGGNGSNVSLISGTLINAITASIRAGVGGAGGGSLGAFGGDGAQANLSLTSTGAISANSLNGSTDPNGGFGTNITLTAGTTISLSTVTTTAGHQSGDVMLIAGQSINFSTINAFGYTGRNGVNGTGGNPGGFGGDVSLIAGSTIGDAGNFVINTNGGTGGTGGDGTFTGGFGNGGAGGQGGQSGTITLSANGNIGDSVSPAGILTAAGGAGGVGGNAFAGNQNGFGGGGGSAGTITVASNGNIGSSIGAIFANGGTGGTTNPGNPSGGTSAADGGGGGNGGIVSIRAAGNIGTSTSTVNTISVNGGTGATGGLAANTSGSPVSAGNGGPGGNAGYINLYSGGTIGQSIGTLQANGGGGGAGGTGLSGTPENLGGIGGNGGNGGIVQLFAAESLGTLANPLADADAIAGVGGPGGFNCCPNSTQQASGSNGLGGYMLFASGGTSGINFGSTGSLASLAAGSITFVTGYGSVNPVITKVMPTGAAYDVDPSDLTNTQITINGSVYAANPFTAVHDLTGASLAINNISGTAQAYSVTASLAATGLIAIDPAVTDLTSAVSGAPTGQDVVVFNFGNITDNGSAGTINQSALTVGDVGGQIIIVTGANVFFTSATYGAGTGIAPFLTLSGSPGSGGAVDLQSTDLNTNSNLVFVQSQSPDPTTPMPLSVGGIFSNGSQASTPSTVGLPGGIIIAASQSTLRSGALSAVGGNGTSGFEGGSGSLGGVISITAGDDIQLVSPITAYGGAGAGAASASLITTALNGGAGGSGGIVNIASLGSSTFGLTTISDVINVAGGGGGGGGGYNVASANGGHGGVGGAGGLINIAISTINGVQLDGAVIATAGGSGGSAGTSNGTGSAGGGGGGGSLGAGGFGGSGGQGSTPGIPGGDGTDVGNGGAGGLAGASGNTNGSSGSNAGLGSVPGGQVVIAAHSIAANGTVGPGIYSSDNINASGNGGQITITTWAAPTNTVYFTNANFGAGAFTAPIVINEGVLTATSNFRAGGTTGPDPISINGVTYASPFAPGTISGPSQIPITENSITYFLTNGTVVTPAERVAAIQVGSSATQQQLLILDGTGPSTGVAVGGVFTVTPENYPGIFIGLRLPSNVTMNFNVANPTFSLDSTISGTFNYSPSSSQITFTTSLFVGGAINLTSVSSTQIQATQIGLFDGASILGNGSLTLTSPIGSNLIIGLTGTASIGVSTLTGTNVNISAPAGSGVLFTTGSTGNLNVQAGSISTPVNIVGDSVLISSNVTITGGSLTSIGVITDLFQNAGTITVPVGGFCCLIGIYPVVSGNSLLVTGGGTLTGASVTFGANPFTPFPANQAFSVTIDGNHIVNGTARLFSFGPFSSLVQINTGASLTASNGMRIDTLLFNNNGTLTETSASGIQITDLISGSGIIDSSTGVFNAVGTTYEAFTGAIQFSGQTTYNGQLIIIDNPNAGVFIDPATILTATFGNGSIAVVSPVGTTLQIAGNGTFQANNINLTATGSDLIFLGSSTLTFNGNSTLSAPNGSVLSPAVTLAHGGFGVTINSPDTANPALGQFDPQTGITRNATGTAPGIGGAAIIIVTDPLFTTGTLIAVSAPVPPTPSGNSNPNSNNNTFVFSTLPDNSQNNVNVQISTRLPTDNTMVLPPGETTEVANPINPLNGHVNRFNESAIEATIVNTSQFTPDIITSLNQNGLTNGSNTGNSYFNLDRGSAIFTPENGPIVVGTHEGDVHIEQGSAVHVYETGADVCIMDLDDRRKGAVRVVAGGKLITLQPGKQLVLSRVMQADYDKVNPVPSIATRHTKKIELENGIVAFVSDFSILSALIKVVPLKQMVNSTDPKQRELAHALLKNAVLITNFSAMTSGPYKASQ